MDQASAQTEKIITYETSRTRRSRVDGKIHSDDSNNDEEYSTSGFYVREKTTEKRPDSANSVRISSDKECKENGISSQDNSLARPVENGDDSRDGESSPDSKKNNTISKTKDLNHQSKKEDQPGTKEDIESENNTVGSVKDQDEKQPENLKDEAKSDTVDSAKDKENSKGDTKDCEKIDDSSSSKDTEGKKTIDKEDDNEKEIKTTQEDKEDRTKVKEVENTGDQNTNKEDTNRIDADNIEEESTLKNNDDTNKADDKTKLKEEKEEEKSDSVKENVEEKSGESKDNKEDHKKDDENDREQSTSETEKEETSSVSILKGQLEKPSSGNHEENVETEMDMDEDFDPSLLCPDISMDVDEAPVITNTETIPEDGSTSPLPYEATFSTLVDEITGAEVQVDLTPEEMELRSKMYGPNNPVQATKVHCTACNIHLGSALTGANNRFVHPLLKVLICKNCYHFYTSGEFEKDEDGSELYCRWCGQGGQVLCCSSCEFVFCKRCIRNNFGPRKFKEIRDSDDWNCFRCDRNQLSNLRASCAEFMEYYRTELARAQALSQTNPELMTTDYTTCCRGGEKKEEIKTPVQQKNARRKRKDEEDPDYHPIVAEEDEPPKKKFGPSIPSSTPGYTVIPPSVRPLLPKPNASQVVRPTIVQPGQKQQNQGQVFKVGNTTFRAKAPANGQGYTVQRPTVSQGQKSNSPGYITIPPSAAPKTTSPGYITIPPTAAPKTTSPGYITIPPSAAPKTTTPGYIKIVPQRMQGPRSTGTYTVVSGTSNGKPTFTTVRPKQGAPMPSMKHEWFEKTVRAAARVNSNLSYTLTQLNRQQSQANSVEALAMVHNKLQEVLSTSINSLIQIRKNLRTEFISGIKNIKFPPKPAPIPPTSGPIVVKDDDDVIFVNSPPKPSTLPSPPPLILSPSVTLTKKGQLEKTPDPFADPKPSTSGVSPKPSIPSTPGKGGFLKVRSFTSLQTVPSECITIPDDPPASSDVKIIEEEDPLKITEEDEQSKDEKEDLPKSPVPEDKSIFTELMVYNTKDEPTPAVKKMLNAVVMVKKSRVVDEIIRAQGLLGAKGKDEDKKEKGQETKLEEKIIEENKDSDKNKSKEEKDKDVVESETIVKNSSDKIETKDEASKEASPEKQEAS